MRKNATSFFGCSFQLISLNAQTDLPAVDLSKTGKSIKPLLALPAEALAKAGIATYAVVIGISDYQDKDIPDLRFADKDAEAFANFLRSPAGGGLDNDHLNLLTNQNATLGRLAEALDALLERVQENDQIILYFSGHGDVERKTISQPGYLLCWDAPPAVYMAGGAFKLADLQEIVTTLSVQNKAKVVVIADACHAGKLAGNQIGGAQLTSVSLARQYANEVKILSCQPNEISLEGEQWGGGRGIFSYHLLDGMFGLADRNGDGQVSLGELDRYLEDHVTAEAAPQSQVPMLFGNKTERLATVNPQILADLQKFKSGQVAIFAPVEQRGFEDEILAKADSSIREQYLAFKKAVREKRFFCAPIQSGESTDLCAESLYALLSENKTLAPLRGMMKRNYAATLMDDAQQVINKMLKTDPATLSNIWGQPFKLDHIPDQLHRAAELLGEQHYIYKSLKAKEFYFLEKKTRLENYPSLSSDSIKAVKLQLLRQGLAFDSTAAYLWESHFRIYGNMPEFEPYIKKALEYSPNWALLQYELGAWYEIHNEHQRSVDHYEQCIAMAPDFLNAYAGIAWALESQGETARANQYFTLYVDKIKEKLAKDSTEVTTWELNGMANVLWKLRRYRESVFFSKKVLGLTNGRGGFGVCLSALIDQGKFEESLTHFEKWYTDELAYWSVTTSEVCFYYLHDTVRAEYWYQKAAKASLLYDPMGHAVVNISIARFYQHTGRPQKALELLFSFDSDRPEYLFVQGDALKANGRKKEAQLMFDSVLVKVMPVFVKNDCAYDSPPDFVFQTIAFHRLGKKRDFQKNINQALKDADGWRYFWLAGIYALTAQPKKAMKYLLLAEKSDWLPNPASWINGTAKDGLLDPLRALPAFQTWEKRWLPPYKDFSED